MRLKKTKALLIPSFASCLDALEDALVIKKGSSTIKKHGEALEMSRFGNLQEGALKERNSKLETEIFSLLDALEEEVGIKKVSSAIKKLVEALEMSWFGNLQKGALEDRMSKLELEILWNT
eukprot:8024242-Ditylum_brightwellii.AAC.1